MTLKTNIKKFFRCCGIVISIVIIGTALLFATLKFITHRLIEHRAQVEQIVSQIMEQPITISSIDIGHRKLAPVFKLHDVSIFTDDKTAILVKVNELQIGIDIIDSLLTRHIKPSLLSVNGANILLYQQPDGKIIVSGIKQTTLPQSVSQYSRIEDMAEWLLTQGQIELNNINLVWQPNTGKELHFINLHLILSNETAYHKFIATGQLLQNGIPTNFNCSLNLDGNILKEGLTSATGFIDVRNLYLQIPTESQTANYSFLPKQINIHFSGKNLHISFTNNLFRQPLAITQISSDINWQHTQCNDWQINATDIKAQNQQVTVQGNMKLLIPNNTPDIIKSPIIDLQVAFKGTGINNAKLYFPKTIPPTALDWLDHAFISGDMIAGKMILKGPLDKFPFDNQEGTFLVDSTVSNITLNYSKDWPYLKNIFGQLIFAGRSMRVEANSSNIVGTPATHVTAIIPNLAQPILKIHGIITADSRNGLYFIHSSPLKTTIGHNLKGINLAGPMNLDLKLLIPLDAEVEKQISTQVNGEITLQKNKLQFSDCDLKFTDINGNINFTENKLTASQLTAQLFNKPTTININTLNPGTQNSTTQVQLAGTIATSDLQNYWKTNFITQYFQGSTNYQAELQLSSANNKRVLKVNSDLSGVTIALPEPLRKTAHETRAFTFNYDLCSDKQVQNATLNYGNQFKMWMLFNKDKTTHNEKLFSANLHFGAGDISFLQQAGISISGNIPKIIWSDWHSTLFDKNKIDLTHAKNLVRQVNITTPELHVWDQILTANTAIQADHQKQEWLVSILNPNAEGKLVISSGSSQTQIQADFQKLYLQKQAPAADLKSQQQNKTSKSLLPSDIPSTKLTINDFRYNNKPLGALALDTLSQNNQLHINKFSITAPDFNLNAQGMWSIAGGQQQTSLQGTFGSQNFGAWLTRGEITNNLIDGNGTIAFTLNWPDAFYKPTFKIARGALALKINNGRITNLSEQTESELGLGRVLTLLSLQSLPRRLTLDFSDLTKKGYSFDTLTGDLALHDGSIFTDNTKFNGSVARISVHGRIGLSDKDYDLLLRTTPHITSSLPVIAAITGGPMVGAATWLANKVIGYEVGRAITYTYKITGPWTAPTIEKVNLSKTNSSKLTHEQVSLQEDLSAKY